MKPICMPCQRFFRMVKSGLYFTEGMPVGRGEVQPGTSEPERWQPYKVWAGDVWECHGCGARIISGTGQHPISEHYMPDFADVRAKLNAAEFQVNDC
jgi:hypothetical protein